MKKINSVSGGQELRTPPGPSLWWGLAEADAVRATPEMDE